MFDDWLSELFGEAVFGRLGHSRRAQLLARMFFGLLGARARNRRHYSLRPSAGPHEQHSHVDLHDGHVRVPGEFFALQCRARSSVGLARQALPRELRRTDRDAHPLGSLGRIEMGSGVSSGAESDVNDWIAPWCGDGMITAHLRS